MKSRRGKMTRPRTAEGLRRYEIEVWHEGLSEYEVVRHDERHLVELKALAKMKQWDDMWERREAAEQLREEAAQKRREREKHAEEIRKKKELEAEQNRQEREKHAEEIRKKKELEAAQKRQEHEKHAEEIRKKNESATERTEEAQAALDVLDAILGHALGVDHTLDWEALKVTSDYPRPMPVKPSLPAKPQLPHKPTELSPLDFPPRLGFLGWILPARRAARQEEAQRRYAAACKEQKDHYAEAVEAYNTRVREFNGEVTRLGAEHAKSVTRWRDQREDYLRRKDKANAAIDAKRRKYMENEAEAVIDYCEMVLANSEYPDWFPQSCQIDYNPSNRILIVDYEFPGLESLPTLKEVSYVQSRDEFEEKHISDAELQRKYDGLLYQIALRTLHEFYEADVVEALASIVFNGYVESVDAATGQQVHPCVLSVQANREEFIQINLAAVDAKACFKKLKGVGSSELHSMTPVAPVLRIDREDGRFVAGRDVVEGLTEDENLAAMDWQDFEHLIRELFEEEFAHGGGEVRITQASRDGGVEAVVFDPDPIRGGKIVVQAKRYTNIVPASAVRELWGTVGHEGANKGILVSTSDYGADAYAFAKGKPLVLLNGGQLLHMLERHGHKAKIDIPEAKRLLSERDSS